MATVTVNVVNSGLSNATFRVTGTANHLVDVAIYSGKNVSGTPLDKWSSQNLRGSGVRNFRLTDFGITPTAGSSYTLQAADRDGWNTDRATYTCGNGNINITLNSSTTTSLNVTAEIDGYNSDVDPQVTLWISLYNRNGTGQVRSGTSSTNGTVTINFSGLDINTMYWVKSSYLTSSLFGNKYRWSAYGTNANTLQCIFKADQTNMRSCKVTESYYDATEDAASQDDGSNNNHPTIEDGGNRILTHFPTPNYQAFHKNAKIEFNAIPNEHYTINWRSGGNASGALLSTNESYTITSLDSAFTIYAHAIEDEKYEPTIYADLHTIIDVECSWNSNENRTILAGNNQKFVFYKGESITCTVRSNDTNYDFDHAYWDSGYTAPVSDGANIEVNGNIITIGRGGSFHFRSLPLSQLSYDFTLYVQGSDYDETNGQYEYQKVNGFIFWNDEDMSNYTDSELLSLTTKIIIPSYTIQGRQEIKLTIPRNKTHILIKASNGIGEDLDCYLNTSPSPRTNAIGVESNYITNESNLYCGSFSDLQYLTNLVGDKTMYLNVLWYNTEWSAVGIRSNGVTSASVSQIITANNRTFTRKGIITSRGNNTTVGINTRRNYSNIKWEAVLKDNVSFVGWYRKNSSNNFYTTPQSVENPYSSTSAYVMWAMTDAPETANCNITLHVITDGVHVSGGNSENSTSLNAYKGSDKTFSIQTGETAYIIVTETGGYKIFNYEPENTSYPWPKTGTNSLIYSFGTDELNEDFNVTIVISGGTVYPEFNWSTIARSVDNNNILNYTTGQSYPVQGWKWNQAKAAEAAAYTGDDTYKQYYGFYLTHGEWNQLRQRIRDWEDAISKLSGHSNFTLNGLLSSDEDVNTNDQFTAVEYQKVLNALQLELEELNLTPIKTESGVLMDENYSGIQQGAQIKAYYLNVLMSAVNRIRQFFVDDPRSWYII